MRARFMGFCLLGFALLFPPAPAFSQAADEPEGAENPSAAVNQAEIQDLKARMGQIQAALELLVRAQRDAEASSGGGHTPSAREVNPPEEGGTSVDDDMTSVPPPPRPASMREPASASSEPDSSATEPKLVPRRNLSPVSRAEFEELKRDVVALGELANNQAAVLADIAKSVPAGSGEGWVPNLLSAMDSSDFQGDLERVVHNALREKGSLVLENKTDTDHTVRVNGRETHRVPAGKSTKIPVAVGTVSVELIGYEPPKQWVVTPPTYVQRITIARPEPAKQGALEPIADGQAVVQRPIYIEPVYAMPTWPVWP